MKYSCKILSPNGSILQEKWAKQLVRIGLFHHLGNFNYQEGNTYFKVKRHQKTAYLISNWKSKCSKSFCLHEKTASNCLCMLFVLKGDLHYQLGSNCEAVIHKNEFNFWFLPQGEKVKISFPKQSVLHVLRCQLGMPVLRYWRKKYPNLLMPIFDVVENTITSKVFHEHALCNASLKQLIHQLRKDLKKEQTSDMLYEIKVLEVICRVLQIKETTPVEHDYKLHLSAYDQKQLHKMHSYLCDHLGESHTIHSLSKHFGLNANKISYGFKQMFGNSPKQYMIARRMQKAHQLLHRKKLCISDVMQKVGYETASGFSHAYKKYFGVSLREEGE
jgi:AraC-like DNA-binding protein